MKRELNSYPHLGDVLSLSPDISLLTNQAQIVEPLLFFYERKQDVSLSLSLSVSMCVRPLAKSS